MDTPPSRLRGKPSWLLNKTSAVSQRLLVDKLSGLGAHGYHFALLAAIEEFGPNSQAALSQACGIDRSDTVAMLNELADQGLVTREPDPADRRRNIISITPAGRRRLDQLDTVLTDLQAELLAPLSPPERDQLRTLLGQVFDHHHRP